MRRILLLLLLSACSAPTAPVPTLPPVVELLGDSIFQFMHELVPWFGPDAALWTNEGREGTGSDYARARVPRVGGVVVLLVGINDIRDGRPERIALNYQAITDTVLARHMTPVVATILPVARDYPDAEAINRTVRSVNAWIRTFAVSRNVRLADTWTAIALPDSTGDRSKSMDGLHPNDDGYRAITAVIASTLRR